MENLKNSQKEEIPFKYLTLSLLPKEIRENYGSDVTWRAEIRIPDAYNSSTKIVLYIDENLCLVGNSVRSINTRYPVTVNSVQSFDETFAPIGELITGLRKLHEFRCRAQPKPDCINKGF